MALGKPVYFKKLVEGSVSLYLQDVEGSLQNKWFVMDSKVPRIAIPANYALSIFIDRSVEAMVDANYVEVEDMAGLIKLAEDQGYISPSEEQVKTLTAPKRTKETIIAILKGGNETKIKELLASSDKERAVELAIANSKNFSLDAVNVLEKILGMAIIEE